MPSSKEIEEGKRRAEATVRDGWKLIASRYTFGWGGPIENIEQTFPFLREAILDIRDRISADLPIVILQARAAPDQDSTFIVPFWKDSGNPFNSRVIPIADLSPSESNRLGMFAQAFWFLIHHKVLPDPWAGEDLERVMRRWTGSTFFT